MLFTREQLEGFYYLMVGVLLLVGIPLFCERFHSGGDDAEGEELWADAGGSSNGSGGGSVGSGAGFSGFPGDGATGGSGSGSLYEDSLFLPSSNSSSSNTPGSSGSGSSGSVGSGGANGSTSSGGVSGGQSGGVTGAWSSGNGGSAGNQGGGSAGNQGGGVAKTGSSGGSSTSSSRNSGSSKSPGSGRTGGSQGRSGGSQGRSYGQREVKVVEINRADSAELTTVRGIGPVYASIIIRYRERLGGFFDTRQLKELNLKYFDYEASSPYLRVDTTFIEKRHIEELTFKELVHHPYLEYEMVSLIFQYERENPGEPVTVEKLGEAGILRPALLKKLSPYFY